MNDNRTLFCLFFCVVANFHKGFNYPIKSVYIIVPHNKIIGKLLSSENIRFNIFQRS